VVRVTTAFALATPPSRIDPALLADWRSRGFRTDERIGWILEAGARSWPDRVAVQTSTRVVTFAQLQEQSSAVARTLVDHGVRAGEVVAWMLPTDADAIAIASAIWRIGAVSSPIVPLYAAREMTAVLDQTHPAAIITDVEVRGRALADEFDAVLDAIGHRPRVRMLLSGGGAGSSGSTGWISATASGPGSLPEHVQPSAADDPCLILFTSGTEAAPKGAVHTAAGINHEVRSCVTEWGVTFRDRMFMASPMTHITGLLQGFLIPARTGASAVLMDRWNGHEAVELIERTGATYMAGATPFLRELNQAYRTSGAERSSLRQYCCGGASVPPELIREVGELGIAAYRLWGMTELPTSTLANELDPLEVRADSDGRLAPGVELRILDDDGGELGVGEIGALQLRGPEMMLGYLQPEISERAFRSGGWFDTGDVGTIDEAGAIHISGRTKDIINRGGEKYSAREIEEVIARHPDVSAVAVVAVPGGRLGERIGAVIVSSRPLTVEELGAHVTRAGLARHKQPELLAGVDAIPVNATGKVDKLAVLALLPEGR
jgi:acyl-CoA synthetase (AMP-forming)/AMP-acid ligase II